MACSAWATIWTKCRKGPAILLSAGFSPTCKQLPWLVDIALLCCCDNEMHTTSHVHSRLTLWKAVVSKLVTLCHPCIQGRVANPRPVAKIKTGRVSQPITDAVHATGRDRSWIATRPGYFNTTWWKGNHSSFLTPTMVTGRRSLPSKIWAQSASPLQKTPTSTDFGL